MSTTGTSVPVKLAAGSPAAAESVLPLLPVNPWFALAVALVRPLASLFRRRLPPPLAVQRMKLESYRAAPLAAELNAGFSAQEGSSKNAGRIQAGWARQSAGSRSSAGKGGLRHG